MSNDYEEDVAYDDPFAEAQAVESMPEAEGELAQEAPIAAATPRKQGTQYRKPKMDLYTVLLLLSLIFISVATAIHYFECSPYEYGTPPFKEGSPIAKP
ncbi:MAG: hypothetical protein Q4D62_14045 [Planctomycetia bacterium]|nr:hypothetical protein [Planctomycetia bacterium]